MPPAPVNHDPALSHNTANGAQQPSQSPSGIPQSLIPPDMSNVQLDPTQVMALLRSLPNVFNKLTEQGNLKEDAAQTLSNLSQAPFPAPGPHPGQQHPYPGQQHAGGGLPGVNDPGPSSHPRGPPNLGQLSALAMSAAPASAPPPRPGQPQEMEEASEDDHRISGQGSSGTGTAKEGGSATATTTRGRGRSAAMGSDEWTRQRKDNHKEVERRRRGNINEGINELGRIVPNGSGEKAKGAILSRAVQYIHHLKENEARNIEKWTLEKLLMDQAMGDLQTQLEELKKAWENESLHRMRLESELEALRGHHAAAAAAAANANANGQNQNINQQQKQSQEGPSTHTRADSDSLKRGGEDDSEDKDNKRPRTE